VVTGLVCLLFPPVPRFLLTVQGLGLMGADLRIVARWLDQAELFVRRSLNIRCGTTGASCEACRDV
jgi:hypothetical protein